MKSRECMEILRKWRQRKMADTPCFRKIYKMDICENGNKCTKYIMNRDGFSLAMGFTGKKALEWKWQYIKAFNQMEAFIKEKTTQTWVETRKAGKLTRKSRDRHHSEIGGIRKRAGKYTRRDALHDLFKTGK